MTRSFASPLRPSLREVGGHAAEDVDQDLDPLQHHEEPPTGSDLDDRRDGSDAVEPHDPARRGGVAFEDLNPSHGVEDDEQIGRIVWNPDTDP